MRQLTPSENHNLEWLKSVLHSPEYTQQFKEYTQKDIKRLETIFQDRT